MECQILFAGKNKKNIINFLSAGLKIKKLCKSEAQDLFIT